MTSWEKPGARSRAGQAARSVRPAVRGWVVGHVARPLTRTLQTWHWAGRVVVAWYISQPVRMQWIGKSGRPPERLGITNAEEFFSTLNRKEIAF